MQFVIQDFVYVGPAVFLMYGLARYAFAEGNLSWLSDNIKINLVTSGYTPNFTTDQYLSIIGGGNIVATSANLASKTDSLGTVSAANVTFSAVSGSTATYIGMYYDTGSSSTSPLIILIDTASNLPVTPNGGNIVLQWGTSIFTLCEGLKHEDKRLVERIADWLRGWKIPAERDSSGLWIPSPKVVLA